MPSLENEYFLSTGGRVVGFSPAATGGSAAVFFKMKLKSGS